MRPVQPSPEAEHRSADADLLGDAAVLHPPGAAKPDQTPAPAAAPLPEPPPAEDHNQPGFIGERNRPAP